MARPIERHSGGTGGKLFFYVALIGVVVWASREPHQALGVLHSLAGVIAHITQQSQAHKGAAK